MPRRYKRKHRQRLRRKRGRKVSRIPRTINIMNPLNSITMTFKDITNKVQTSDFIVYNRQVKLDGFAKTDKFTPIFAQYRIISYSVKYMPQSTAFIAPQFSDGSGGESADIVSKTMTPRLFIRDNKTGDTSIPASVDEMYLEGWKVKSMKHGQNRKVQFKPNTLDLGAESTGDTVSNTPQWNKWFSTQDDDVLYQGGIQAVVANGTAAAPYNYKILETIVVQFRNLDYNPN